MKTYMFFDCNILKETERAFMVNTGGEWWLPKSQVRYMLPANETQPFTRIAIPAWLYAQKKSFIAYELYKGKLPESEIPE